MLQLAPGWLYEHRMIVPREREPRTMIAKAIRAHEAEHLELPWLSGAVVDLGAEGIPTPVNTAIVAALTPYVRGRRR